MTLDKVIGFMVILGSLCYVLTMRLVNKFLFKHQNDIRDATSKAQGVTTDLIFSWKDIILTGSRGYSEKIIEKEIATILNNTRTFYFKRGLLGFLQASVVCAIIIIANYYQITKYLNKAISIGDIVLMNNYLLILRKPLESLSLILRGFSRNMSDLSSISDIISYEKQAVKNQLTINQINSIHLENITTKTLYKTNLTIRKGEKIAIIGKSGSGKSTILDILVGLHNEYEGLVYFNNDRNFKLSGSILNNFISYFNSDSRLMNQTLIDNVTMGKSIDPLKYLQNAFLDTKIECLHQGLNTVLSDKTELLSSGEMQRIKIARLFAQENEIELYDEATSALDKQLANNIVDRIVGQKDKTIIFVTHDEDLINKFEIVYSLCDGLLTELKKDYKNVYLYN
jgi:ABC-type bacteriocin/lantibiotic exporter with double-glycine peptidase domain